MEYVDLGLPSGTLWADANEDDFYTFDEAVSKYGKSLPTREQLKELRENCRWDWIGNGCRVTGPNGNTIVLPAAGFRNCNEPVKGVGSCGYYWSSTPSGSDFAWFLNFYFDFDSCSVYFDFDSCSVVVDYGSRCDGGISVRLVK